MSRKVTSVPEQRLAKVALVGAALIFAGGMALRFAVDAPAAGILLVYVIPVALVALYYGIPGGLATGAIAISLIAIWSETSGEEIGAVGYLSRIVSLVAIGLLVGFVSSRLRGTVESALASEERAREAERSLEHAARHFEVSHDMHCTATTDGYFRDLNRRWEETLGWTTEELRSRPFVEFVHPEDREATAAQTAQLGHGAATVDFSNRYRGKNGDWHWLAWAAAAEPDEGLIYASARDITDQREIERAKDELISVVSHELRSPLTAIRSSLGLLENGVFGPLPDKGQKMIELAVENTDRLVRLINDILDLERIESGVGDMHLESCDAGELIAHAAESLQPLAAEANVRLTVDSASESLSADRDRVLQALTNLISNAVKFSPVGGTVRVSSARRNNELLFSVADEGCGIPADKLESVFERFQQVDPSDAREKSGTGLGLAISQRIVDNHGGVISVESELGKGSTFMFALPVETVDEPTQAGRGPARDRWIRSDQPALAL
jgi:PAS domain S-box-containing protein